MPYKTIQNKDKIAYRAFLYRLGRTAALVGNVSTQCDHSDTAWLVAMRSRSRQDTQTVTPNLMTTPKCHSTLLLPAAHPLHYIISQTAYATMHSSFAVSCKI